MNFRKVGIGLVTGVTGLTLGCSAPANPEAPPTIDTSAQEIPYLPCFGYVGKISLINPDLMEFKVDSIQGSSGCSETPVTAGIIAVGSFQTPYEHETEDLWVGDTFRAECTITKPPAALIHYESDEGVIITNDRTAVDALAEVGAPGCNERQLNKVYGR